MFFFCQLQFMDDQNKSETMPTFLSYLLLPHQLQVIPPPHHPTKRVLPNDFNNIPTKADINHGK